MTGIRLSDIAGLISQKFLHGREIGLDEDILLSGLIDSLGIVALVSQLEEMSGTQIPPQDVRLENFQSVRAIGAYLGAA